MKAHQIGDKIEVYNNLPKSFGNVIGGFNNLSDVELETHGFYDVEDITTTYSDFDSRLHDIGTLSFDSDNSIFKYSKIDKTFSKNISELKSEKIDNLKQIYYQKLYKTDWIILRDKELGNVTNQSTLDTRAALRTECSDKEAEITALSTKENIVKYDLPETI